LSFLPGSLPSRPPSLLLGGLFFGGDDLTPRGGHGLPVALRGFLHAIDAFGDLRARGWGLNRAHKPDFRSTNLLPRRFDLLGYRIARRHLALSVQGGHIGDLALNRIDGAASAAPAGNSRSDPTRIACSKVDRIEILVAIG
jgi:hypothetical protein